MYEIDEREQVIDELEQDINELNASLYQAELTIGELEEELKRVNLKHAEQYLEATKYKQLYQSLIVELVNLSKQ